MSDRESVARMIDLDALPEGYLTQTHDALFWERLGRAVATYGFLEQVLGKAIYALTATRRYPEDEVEQAIERWRSTLEGALFHPLRPLIDAYGKALREHPDNKLENVEEFLDFLREAADMRNLLCHASWQPPDSNGASLPFFANRHKGIVESPIDSAFLDRVRQATVELACEVVGTITRMGWQFPGSNGPGKPIGAES